MRKQGLTALVVGVAVGLTAVAAFAHVAQGPSPSYPAEPRTTSGGSPYKVLPKPIECSPARDRPGAADYVRLAQLPQRQSKNPFAPNAASTTALDLVNAKKQKFLLYVSAGSAAPVRAYIQVASACAEAFSLQGAAPTVLDPVHFHEHLITTATRVTGLSVAALSQRRDQLAATGNGSLLDVVVAAGGDADSVIENAVAVSEDDLAARVAAGELTAAEVAALDVGVVIKRLATQAGAPFLNSPAADGGTPAAFNSLLAKDPRNTVLVGIVPVTTLPKRPVVWAAFDFVPPPRRIAGVGSAMVQGPLGNGQYHHYVAKCQPSASAQIRAWNGAGMLKLWRVSDWSDYANSYASDSGASRKLYRSWPSNRTYDTWVKGLQNNTSYSMYYGWVRGTGGGC